MGRFLFIVARERPDLYAYLTWHFSGEEDARVILDRRHGERRREIRPHKPERRRGERRGRIATRDPFALQDVVVCPIDDVSFGARPGL